VQVADAERVVRLQAHALKAAAGAQNLQPINILYI
jgi:hypothetical protein